MQEGAKMRLNFENADPGDLVHCSACCRLSFVVCSLWSVVFCLLKNANRLAGF